MAAIYTPKGDLSFLVGETVVRVFRGWDMSVRSPWRKFLPGMVFSSLHGDVSSSLYITSKRIVFIRNIDIWKEVKPLLTPLGLPAAAEKEAHLKRLRSVGARKYCEIWPSQLAISRTLPLKNGVSLLTQGLDGRQYAISFWNRGRTGKESFALIESRFIKG